MSPENISPAFDRRAFLRTSALVGLSIPMAGLLASCAAPGGGGGGSGSVTMWSWNALEGEQHKYFLDIADVWEGEAEGNTFKYTFLDYGTIFTKYKTALAGGSPPEIIGLEDSGVLVDMVESSALEPLNSLVAELPALHKGTMDYIGFDGEAYMVPISLAALGLNFNKTMFEDFGIAYPTTLQELIDAAAEFKAGGVEGIGAGFQDGQFVSAGIFMSCMANLDGIDDLLVQAKAGEPVWDDPRWLEGAKYLEAMAKGNVFSPGSAASTTRDQIAQWASGKVAMLWPATTWMWGLISETLNDAFPVEIGVFPPKDGGVGRAVGGQSTSFGVAPGSDVDAAKAYLKQIYSPEGTELLVASNTIPALAEFELPAELPHPMFGAHVEQMKTAVQRNVLDKGWNEVILEMVSGVLFRGNTAEELAEAIKTRSGTI